MIEINNISKVFRTSEVETVALNHVNLEVKEGEFVAIMGPSGCGKSTLLNILGLLDNPTEGSYRLMGEEVGGLKEKERTHVRKGKLGFVFQSFNLFNNMTVFDNCMAGVHKVKKRSKEYSTEICMKYLEKVGMAPYVKAKPHQLSGGMKQRVLLAQALLGDPKILILDEPTAGLDVMARESILNLFREYMEEDGERTILISSHISSDLEGLCDDIYMIHEGRIIFHEDTDVLLNQYGLLKVDEKQFEELDKRYLLKKRKEHYGYACLTKEKQYYIENYPDIVVEKGTVDELIAMMIGGNEL